MVKRFANENTSSIKIEIMLQQTAGNVVFDPKDINYGIIPTIEYRQNGYLGQFGLDHHGFHEIDRKDFATVYWNRGFIGGGTVNYRLGKY